MDARKHLIIIKGKDQTDSVASFRFHDGKCEVIYTSEPNKVYDFQGRLSAGSMNFSILVRIIALSAAERKTCCSVGVKCSSSRIA